VNAWKFFVAAALAIAVGVGVGYYAFDASYNDIGQKQYERLQSQILRSPSPTPSADATVLPSADKEANATGEVYVTPDASNVYDEQYILKEYLGRIAVYKTYTSGQTTLMNIVDVSTDALPESDRKLLSNGIQGLSYEDMLQLLEDYTS